ncbi:hypothetical protein RFI_35272 [Reticulomyxa filosa]|uniref:Uncharacterized protein n=1 Tax=Reticulomyxa filosa TaxID=46433 RepID=X6LJM3_RETFI|nr:hypothetical protein RFI_35272 [Reticulomyxa filosa]|eukprot:ETO02163.1 hypothetical protein RFI_35272 [Reticulomyxa filosa]
MIKTDLPLQFAPTIAAGCTIIPSIRRTFIFLLSTVLRSLNIYFFVYLFVFKQKKEVKELNIATLDNTVKIAAKLWIILALLKCVIETYLNDEARLVKKKSAAIGNVDVCGCIVPEQFKSNIQSRYLLNVAARSIQ